LLAIEEKRKRKEKKRKGKERRRKGKNLWILQNFVFSK